MHQPLAGHRNPAVVHLSALQGSARVEQANRHVHLRGALPRRFPLALDWVLGSITNLLISIVVTVLFFQFGIFLPFLRLRKVGPQVNSEA
jgi:hypothetical protein